MDLPSVLPCPVKVMIILIQSMHSGSIMLHMTVQFAVSMIDVGWARHVTFPSVTHCLVFWQRPKARCYIGTYEKRE